MLNSKVNLSEIIGLIKLDISEEPIMLFFSSVH